MAKKREQYIQEDVLLRHLRKQVDAFVDALESYNKKRSTDRKRPQADYDYLRDFYKRYFADRNSRAYEVTSSRYKIVVKLANEQFPVPTSWVLCMDGRVLPVLISGASANIGDSMRMPGGNLREFVRGEHGEFKLLPKSTFATLLGNAFRRTKGNTIAEVFDSHVGCAAVKVEEENRGRSPKDGGLLHDIQHKREMAQATVTFVKAKFGDKKKIIVIQTSFNPHNGYMYMGLETEAAMQYAKQYYEKTEGKQSTIHNRGAYTQEVLLTLIDKENIISTSHLASDPQVQGVLKKYAFIPNWQSEYTQTAAKYWEAIKQMKGKLLPIIEKKLRTIYPDVPDEEIKTRALLVLTNTFSGYLHNQHDYPLGQHEEEMIAVAEAGYTPYALSSFLVSPYDEMNLAANILLASSLVRRNRIDQRVKDRSKSFTDPTLFSEAPVPMIIQEIIRDDLTEEEWEDLVTIDWSDMPANWDQLSDVEFLLYLQPKGKIPIAAAMAINRLRKRIALLFHPDQVTSAYLLAHHKIALPKIVSRGRISYCIIPFLKHGLN